MSRFTADQLDALKAIGISQTYQLRTPEAPQRVQEDELRSPEAAQTSTVSDPVSNQPRRPNALASAASRATTGSDTLQPRPKGSEERLPIIRKANLEQLAELVQQCRACGLCRERKQAVIGTGDLSARWMVVGEAPGADEDEQGLPFVGRSGRLLDAMLGSMGLSRQSGVYIANVIKCRPPANRNPEPDEVLACEPFLLRQLELIQPDIILAMGRFAVTTLLQSKDAIGSLRLKEHHYQGIPVVVTYHPAYLLRNLAEKAKAWRDICFAQSLAAKRKQAHQTDA